MKVREVRLGMALLVATHVGVNRIDVFMPRGWRDGGESADPAEEDEEDFTSEGDGEDG